MTNAHGYRRGTRYMFARAFRHRGYIPLSTYMRVYKRGDFVSIKGTGTIQKGMPHKVYHGRTGRVFDVTPHAVGIVVNKRVKNRIIEKRIHVRVEHVRPNRARELHRDRVRKNEDIKKQARLTHTRVPIKRLPAQPRPGHMISVRQKDMIEVLAPLPYEFVI